MTHKFITSESVTEGHPDKVCDQISDAILDEYLKQDPNSHVAVETSAARGIILIFGEVKSAGNVDIQTTAREVIRRIGYTDASYGLDADSVGIINALNSQSAEIDNAVDRNAINENNEASKELLYKTQGAGDQGIMFGYATDETDVLMPLPILLAHRIAQRLAYVRKAGIVRNLRPDGKTQVTVEYDENDRPVRIDTILISTQHDAGVTHEYLEENLRTHVINPVLEDVLGNDVEDGEKDDDGNAVIVKHDDYRSLINPTGSFILGGPGADAGLTGRKIIVDTYGGLAHHGGGCFSGKDASKVDRSAAYAARWVAKNIVAAGLAHRAELQISYAIGVAEPVSINVNTFGTENIFDTGVIEEAVRRVFDLRPAAIIDELGLKAPVYSRTAAYGHFGRADADFTWEHVNKVDALKAAVQEITGAAI